jgi:hypothetical protein
LTRQEIVQELNRLKLQHNLTWPDVQRDADKAIYRINAYMGAQYPKMSDILLSDTSTYTVRVDSVDHPFFPEQYILEVVIPYIAMEVLARDEEFTTVYNKYAKDLEDGLFNMFQNEFNKVPLAFRQQPDQGVFFASDTVEAAILRNTVADLPVFKFRVYYHINSSAITVPNGLSFVEDTHAYGYGEAATVLGAQYVESATNRVVFMHPEGHTAYLFQGWYRDPLLTTPVPIMPDDELTMSMDMHLYAKWEAVSTLSCSEGELSLVAGYENSITYLRIPDYVNNVRVKEIPTGFSTAATNLSTIVLPKFLTHIRTQAFLNSPVSQIIFAETPLEEGFYEGITIETLAFSGTSNFTSVVLPANVIAIAANSFPVVANKHLDIYCRILIDNEPDGWVPGWYAATSEAANYSVAVTWGYNG